MTSAASRLTGNQSDWRTLSQGVLDGRVRVRVAAARGASPGRRAQIPAARRRGADSLRRVPRRDAGRRAARDTRASSSASSSFPCRSSSGGHTRVRPRACVDRGCFAAWAATLWLVGSLVWYGFFLAERQQRAPIAGPLGRLLRRCSAAVDRCRGRCASRSLRIPPDRGARRLRDHRRRTSRSERRSSAAASRRRDAGDARDAQPTGARNRDAHADRVGGTRLVGRACRARSCCWGSARSG